MHIHVALFLSFNVSLVSFYASLVFEHLVVVLYLFYYVCVFLGCFFKSNFFLNNFEIVLLGCFKNLFLLAGSSVSERGR